MILVTGATGFVGRHVLDRLVARHDPTDIWCLVHDESVSDAERDTERALTAAGVRWSAGELVSGRGLDLLPRAPDAVVHLAACAETAAADHRVNDVGTANLFDAIGPLRDGTPVVFTSSIAVSDHPRTRVRPIDEHSPLAAPGTDYGRRKLRTEQLLGDRAETERWRLHIVRLPVVFGPGSRPDGFADQLVSRSLASSRIARLDFPARIAVAHVDDVADVIVDALDRPGAPRLRYAIGATSTVAELFAAAHRGIGMPYDPIQVPRSVWAAVDALARGVRPLESWLPRRWYDRAWQAGMLVGDGFDCRSVHPDPWPPGRAWRTFESHARSCDPTPRSGS